MTDEDFIREAIKEAEFAKQAGEWPFGAVIVKDGKIIARGACDESSTKNVLGHAELRAISAACTALQTNNLAGCAIYATNEPCLMCASAIIQAKISTVVFSLKRADLAHILRQRNLNIHHLAADAGYEVEITSGVLKEEALKLFNGVKK